MHLLSRNSEDGMGGAMLGRSILVEGGTKWSKTRQEPSVLDFQTATRAILQPNSSNTFGKKK